MPYNPIGKYRTTFGVPRKEDFKRPVTFYDRVRFVGADSTIEIFGGVLTGATFTVEGDIISGDWDGADPVSLATYDTVATAGYAFDSDQGSAQFMGDMFVGGDIQFINGSGQFEWYNTSDVLQATFGWNQVSSFLLLDLQSLGSLFIDNGELGISGAITTHETSTYFQNIDAEYVTGGSTGQFRWHSGVGAVDTTELLRLYYDHDGITGMPVNLVDFEFSGIDPLPGVFKLYVNGQFAASDGTAAAPGFAFNNDLTMGLYRSGTNTMVLATAGVGRFVLGTADFTSLAGTGAASIRYAVGSVATPAFGFSGDPDTGMYRVAANQLGFAAGGTRRLSWTGSAWDFASTVISQVNEILVQDGSVSDPSFTFSNDNNTGLYSVANDYIAMAAGGVILAQWGYTGAAKELYIYGLPSAAANVVQYNGSTGQLSYQSSTKRIKKDISTFKTVGLSDELRAIQYRFRDNDELDEDYDGYVMPDESWHIGQLAEEVASIVPEAALHNDKNQVQNYEDRAVIAILLVDLQDARQRIAALEQRETQALTRTP